MTEVFTMSDGVQLDRDTTGDTQHLIEDNIRWRKLKRNRYKLIAVGLTVVVLISAVAAILASLSGSSTTEQSSPAKDEKPYPEEKKTVIQSFIFDPDDHSSEQNSIKYRNTNEGTRFAIAFPVVHRLIDTCYFECHITTRESTNVHFDSPYLSLDKTVSLAGGVSYRETFDSSIKTSGGIEHKAIYVNASRNIVVQCAAKYINTFDSFLALPYGEEHKEYYIAVCDDYAYNSNEPVGFVNIVALTANTRVSIICPLEVSECPAQEYALDLNLYQVYSLYVSRYSDLTGFYISATHPVSVYTGCPNLSLYEGSSSDYIFTTFAVPPRQQLGTQHYTPQTTGDPDLNHRLRIVATDTTTVSIPEYGVNQILQDREFLTQDYMNSNGSVAIYCSVACLVVHCNKRHDPETYRGFMMRVTPIEAYTDDMVFSSSYFRTTIYHYLSIVVNQYPVTDLYLDGVALSGEDWIPVDMGNYASVMLSVSADVHQLNSTNAAVTFSAYSHGNKGVSSDFGYGSQAGVGDTLNTVTGKSRVTTSPLDTGMNSRKKIFSQSQNSNEGRQFAIAFPTLYRMGSSFTNYFECFVTTREPTIVEFKSPYLGLDTNVYLGSGVNHRETFSDNIKTSGGIEGKTIYVTADNDIVVQCAARYDSDKPMWDSFLVLPFSEGSTEYYLAVCDDSAGSSYNYVGFVNIVATADDTLVNITCPSGVPECPRENYAVELNLYLVYSLYVPIFSDLSGFYIRASKPVSVYSGSPSLFLYEGSDYRYHFLTFAVPPVQQLGTQHYTPETPGDPSRNHRLRIVATNTTKTNLLIPAYGVDINLKQYEYFTQDYSHGNGSIGPIEVSCSSPCLVVHCNKEHWPDTRNAWMMRVTPVGAYTDNIVFSSPSFYNYTINHYLSIVVNQYPVTDIYLDGSSLSTEDWTPNDSGNYAGVMLTVSSEVHELSTTNSAVKFSAYCLGNQGSHRSSRYYGYGSQAGVGDLNYVKPETRPVPDYKVQLWGNFSSLSGEDFDLLCGSLYSNELHDKADSMIPILNSRLGDQLCSDLGDNDVVVATSSSSLTTSGPNGRTLVAFTMKVDRELRFEEVHDCGAEITIYLLDHDNWGNPLLPPIDGSPFPVFDPQRFYDDGSEWVCVDITQDGQSAVPASTTTVPEYDITIESNFTTFNGDDLSAQCGSDYMNALAEETEEMLQELNSRLGSSMCADTTFTMVTGTSNLFHQGSQGLATVKYSMKSDANHQMEDVFECIDEVLPVVLDHDNWGPPLLPQLPGCPFLVFHENEFWEKEQKWNCDVSSQAGDIL